MPGGRAARVRIGCSGRRARAEHRAGKGDTMKAEIVSRSPGWIVGIEARIVPSQADYRGLWEQQFMPRHEEIKSLSTEGAYYGVYFPCDEPGKADFLAGMMTAERAKAPAGLSIRAVPAGLYARIECAMAELAQTWSAVYREWLPSSGYEEDEARPAIEYYPPEMSGPQSPVTIFVAVRSKP